jgi:hypothetical protein
MAILLCFGFLINIPFPSDIRLDNRAVHTTTSIELGLAG